MSNLEKTNRIVEKIDSLKEILLTMPKNNEKNIQKYKEKLSELTKEYTEYEKKILDEINNRYQQEINVADNPKIKNLSDRLSTIDGAVYVLKNNETSFEKMELDKYIYKISRFYKENLENVNKQIALCIQAFEKTGIKLSADDFNYTIHAKEYMKVFFNEMKHGNLNSDALKNKFDDIYWRCPDIIVHIELNLRYLYLENETNIDKYFEKEADLLLSKWQKAPSDIRNSYLELKRQKLELMAVDKKKILDDFLSGKLKTKDFTEEKVNSNLAKIIQKQTLDKYDNNRVELINNVLKFYNSLEEYKNYLNFKFIIDDIKKYYNEKENYKKVYEETKKQIGDKEKKLQKINKKLSGSGLFGVKRNITKQTAEQSTLISELKTLYKQLDINKFYNKIYSEFNNESTVFDVLNLAASYYFYLTDVIIKNNKTITQEEIDEKVYELDEFLTNPYNTLINNLTILDEKEVALIIKDRYKLLDFIIEKEDLNENNIDSLMETLQQIILGLNIKKANIELEEIDNIFEMRKILKIKNK